MLGSVEQWWVKYFVNSSTCVQQCSTTNKISGSTAAFYISDKRICFLCMCCTRISFVAGYKRGASADPVSFTTELHDAGLL
jgi:hypothetical protein